MSWTRMGGMPGALLGAALGLAAAAPAEAQRPEARPIAIEGTVGWAGFVDDDTKYRPLVGGAVRIPIGGRLSVGPEVVFTPARTNDDAFVLGSLWLDLGPAPERARVVPYVVLGAGYTRHDQRFGSQRFVSGEGSFTAGGGVRAAVTDRLYVGGEARIGWELHLRVNAVVGVTWPRR